MKLTLIIDNKEKNFTAPFISGRGLRKTMELMKNHDIQDLNVETLDTFVNHIISLFGNQFTLDEFYDGIESTEMMPVIAKCLEDVIKKTNDATKQLQSPNE